MEVPTDDGAQIIGTTLRTVYTTSTRRGNTEDRDRRVRDIDEALEEWLDQLPPHLRYSASETNLDWLLQSSRLFLLYYYAQTLVHRPFVQAQQHGNDLLVTLHSMAIVSNASRAGIHIMYNLALRGIAHLVGVEAQLRTLTFSVFLLLISLNALGRNGETPLGVIEDIRKGIYSLRSVEHHWETAKVHADQLTSLLEQALGGADEHRGKDVGNDQQQDGLSAPFNEKLVDAEGAKLPFRSFELQDCAHLFPQAARANQQVLEPSIISTGTMAAPSNVEASAVWPDPMPGIGRRVNDVDTQRLCHYVSAPISMGDSSSLSRLEGISGFDALDALSTIDNLFSDTSESQSCYLRLDYH